VAAVAAALLAACRRDADRAAEPPRAEFLLSAGDSTYWVASGPDGVHVRASPMLLARLGGRLYEVYAADDDRSYYDAVFTTQRVYRRDLLTGDSVSVFDDPTVLGLARSYAAAHPHEAPLDAEEEAADDPQTVATTEVSLVDVHGPFLSLEQRDDYDVDGVRHQHVARRAVVDLRTGRHAALVDLVGDSAAGALVDAGRRRLTAALDSVRALAAGAEGGEPAGRALRSLASFRFDPASFALTDVDGRPAVAFVVPGNDPDDRAVTLPLPAVPVPGPSPAWWEADVRAALPTVAPDSSEARWPLGAHEIVARYGRDREGAALVVRPARGGRAGRPAGAPRRDQTGRAWLLLARVPGPVRQLVSLDRPPIAEETRRALARAFNESALYGEEATSASYRRPR
jgi:hypothetical protein